MSRTANSDAPAKALTSKAAEAKTSANAIRTKACVQRSLAESSAATLKRMETALLECGGYECVEYE